MIPEGGGVDGVRTTLILNVANVYVESVGMVALELRWMKKALIWT